MIHEERSLPPYQAKTYDEKPVVIEEGKRDRGIDSLAGRLDRYAKAVERTRTQASYISEIAPGEDDQRERIGLVALADKLNRCGSYLGFRHYFTVNQLRLTHAHFCQQDKLCGFCQIRRASKILGAYSAKVATVLEEEPNLSGWMVTHTVKDGGDLGERLKHLLTAFARSIDRRRAQKVGKGWTEWARASAGVARVEIKRGKNSGQWHPHIHAAWLCDQAPDQQALRDEWHELTGDSHQVDVRPFRSMIAGTAPAPELLATDLVEVLKYSVKLSDTDPADALHIYHTTRGKKLLRPFGSLHGVKVPDSLLDAPLNDADLPYLDLFFRYSAGSYRS